jgi:hypothetical protein
MKDSIFRQGSGGDKIIRADGGEGVGREGGRTVHVGGGLNGAVLGRIAVLLSGRMPASAGGRPALPVSIRKRAVSLK